MIAADGQGRFNPTQAERVGSLVGALIQIARTEGNGRYTADALHAAVCRHSQDGAYWATQLSQAPRGLIRYEGERWVDNTLTRRTIDTLLEPEGVLAMTDEVTHDVRIVNTEWCETPAKKYGHMVMATRHWDGGRRCRFCLIPEPHESMLLEPVNEDRRGVIDVLNGAMQLQVGQVYTHIACRPHWLRWLDVANAHATEIASLPAPVEQSRKKLKEQRA